MPKAAKKRRVKCLQCSKAAKWRGVCLGCYGAAKRRIAAGGTTDEKLVELGWWKIARKGPHRPHSTRIEELIASGA